MTKTSLIKRIRFSRIFFGWWTVIAGGTLGIWIAGYQTYGISALFKPISSELGFSRTAASVPGGISRLEGGFEGPLSGWATDRFGAKNVILLGVFICGLSLVLMNFINSLWAFYLVWGILLGTGHNMTTTIPIDTAIANWFVKKRGIALGIKMVLNGLSGVLTLPLIAFLISQHGWRMTCLIGGVVMLLIGLPIGWFFFKPHRPEYYGLLPDGATVENPVTAKEAGDTAQVIDSGVKYAAEVEETEFTLRQAMRTPTYWMVLVAQCVNGVVFTAINVHLIPYLTDIGIDPIKAASMMAVMVSSSLPLRFITGFLADRVSRSQLRFVIVVGYLFQALGFAIFLLKPGTISNIYVWLILFGIGHGIAFASIVLVGRYYGRKAYGSIRGSSVAFQAGPGMVAPIYAGWVYDTTGSYVTSFITFGAALAVAIVVMSLAAPPRPPARLTNLREIV